MFAGVALASQIEATEAKLIAATTLAADSANKFARPIGTAVAAFVRTGSPINKVVGLGFDPSLDEGTLAEIEAAYHAVHDPVRVELATLAAPEVGRRLTERGYRLFGFENVLGAPLPPAQRHPSSIRIEPASPELWQELCVEGFAHEDDTGVVVDHYSRAQIEQVIRDFAKSEPVEKFVALLDGAPAAIASMRIAPPFAFMTGATTLPAFRRRGAQSALIQHRLAEAARRNCTLAIVTTAPGTRSQANAMKHGFALLYSRATLQLSAREMPSGGPQ